MSAPQYMPMVMPAQHPNMFHPNGNGQPSTSNTGYASEESDDSSEVNERRRKKFKHT
jgi:hypothetical protein